MGYLIYAGAATKEGFAHVGRLFTAIAEAGVNLRVIDQGSSEMNIIIGVEEQDLDEAVRAIYWAFETWE